jgi:hypothetical protein
MDRAAKRDRSSTDRFSFFPGSRGRPGSIHRIRAAQIHLQLHLCMRAHDGTAFCSDAWQLPLHGCVQIVSPPFAFFLSWFV